MTSVSSSESQLLDGVDPAPLFTPYSLGGRTLANRFVMAPMTRQQSPGGVPGEDVAAYYARRASDLGLLITEATYVDHPSSGTSRRVPRFYGEDALAGWARVVEAVHAEGGLIIPQLWHLGTQRKDASPLNEGAPVINPSGLDLDGTAKGVAATARDVDDIIAAFVQGAADAQRIGFDGIEIHGAHGYLLDQFFWSQTNTRDDEYGGTLTRRVRFAADLVAAVREAVGPDFLVAFRYSQWKGGHYDAQIAQNPAELEQVLTPLVDAGVNAMHVSTRRYWLPAYDDSERTLSGWTKKLTGLPTISVGSVGVATQFRGTGDEPKVTLSLARLVELFEAGEFDLVALGRAVLSEPQWATKVREGRAAEIRPYDKADEASLI